MRKFKNISNLWILWYLLLIAVAVVKSRNAIEANGAGPVRLTNLGEDLFPALDVFLLI